MKRERTGIHLHLEQLHLSLELPSIGALAICRPLPMGVEHKRGRRSHALTPRNLPTLPDAHLDQHKLDPLLPIAMGPRQLLKVRLDGLTRRARLAGEHCGDSFVLLQH